MTRVLVIGFGVTGQATARTALAHDWPVVAVDDHYSAVAAAAARELDVRLVFTPDAARLEDLLRVSDLAVPSPGVPISHPVYELAARIGVEVQSEIELAARVLEARPRPHPRLVAITGTNGKTTVTTQVRAALEESGWRAVAAGNIGSPLVEAVEAVPPPDVIVAEVSSFQLQYTSRFHPDVSCWLNLTPDHLDWHPSHDHYRAAKARIWANQCDGDTVVVNADDADVVASAARRPRGVRLVTFSTTTEADWFERDGILVGPAASPLLPVDELPRALPHDRANALATAAVAAAAGAGVEGIRAALRSTAPGPHRVELIGEAAGIRWYDDSKATTPAAVLAGVAGFDSVVLVAGGRNKGLDLGVLVDTVPPVHAVVAIGEATAEVRAAFGDRVPVTGAASMNEAVVSARRLARLGDAVVLSPGCTSFDWYRSYVDRGADFASLALKIMEKERDRC